MAPAKVKKQRTEQQKAGKSDRGEFIQAILKFDKDVVIPAKFAKEGFGELLWEWVQVAQEKLENVASEHLKLLSKKSVKILNHVLQKRLESLSAYSLVLELNIARITGILDGETPADRYHYFVQKILKDHDRLKAFFDEYTVLSRAIDRLMHLWVEQVAEFLTRLDNDLNDIAVVFNEGEAPGKVVNLKTGLSDPHNGGRGVYLVEFASGLKVVYKPKNVGIEAMFNNLLSMLNDWGLEPAMKTFNVLERDTYGWVEFIENKPCKSKKEFQHFFERSGINLFLFYLLEGTDGHYENLIACGQYPVMIDLETLFHARFESAEEKKKKPEGKTDDYFSVLNTGLLPCLIFAEKDRKGIDISGLMGEEGQESPNLSPSWDQVNTDEMHLKYVPWKTQEGAHRAKLNGKSASANDYVEDIVKGFDKAFDLVKKNRKQLLKQGGIIDQIAAQLVRYVPRATRVYGQVITRLADAQFQRDENAYEKELDLISLYIDEENQHVRPMIEAEKMAIRQRDIPFFNSKPNSKDLFIQEKVIVKNVFADYTIDTVKKRIEALNDVVKQQQQAYIRQSFYSMKTAAHKEKLTIITRAKEKTQLNDDQILRQVQETAEEILSRAIISPDQSLSWLAMELIPNVDQFCFQPISDNLYNGRSGIALFFAALSKITGDKKWGTKALEIIEGCRKVIKKERADLWVASIGIGAMSGASSVAYSFKEIGRLLNEPGVTQDAIHITSLITPEKIKQDTSYDIISGSAGLILVLLSLYEQTQKKELLEKAQLAGDHLLNGAQENSDGVLSWKCIGKEALTGFSHGVAGIAYALLKLGSFTGKELYKKAAEKAMGYERMTFIKKEGNWPDFREKGRGCMVAWCHGASGIGMGRLCSLPYENTPEMHKEIETALKTTQKYLEGNVDFLCCGNFGRIELLRMAGQELKRPELIEMAREEASYIVQMKQRESSYRYFINSEHKFFNPGFMVGASGIGYSLLCFLDKKRVLPRVWVFE